MKDELIDLVFSIPAVWDKRHKQHHNRHVLAREWKKIAAKIGVTEAEARKCWKNVRQEYGKQIKKNQSRSGDGVEDGIGSEWPYFEKLHFLRDQFTPRQSSTNLLDETQDIRDNDSENLNNSEESNSDDERSTCTSITNVMSPNSNSQNATPSRSSSRATPDPTYSVSKTGYKRRITPQIEIGKQLVEIEKKKLALKANKTSQDPNDEDVGFFNSLLPYIKQLTPRQKLAFRMDVQKNLFNILFPSEQQTQARSLPTTETLTRIEHTPQLNLNPLYPSEPIWTNAFQPYQHLPESTSTNETRDIDISKKYTIL